MFLKNNDRVEYLTYIKKHNKFFNKNLHECQLRLKTSKVILLQFIDKNIENQFYGSNKA